MEDKWNPRGQGLYNRKTEDISDRCFESRWDRQAKQLDSSPSSCFCYQFFDAFPNSRKLNGYVMLDAKFQFEQLQTRNMS
jgi:hypothetical protein